MCLDNLMDTAIAIIQQYSLKTVYLSLFIAY